MVKHNVIVLFLFFILALLTECSADKEPLKINFSPDSTAIIFSGIDQAGLTQLRNAQYPDSVLSDLISVLQTPSERATNLKEMPVQGHLELTDSTIVFYPDTSFVSGRDYLVITHLNTSFVDAKRILTNGVSVKLRPVQKVLSR
ncbi:MAG TPA: hypothetical protein VK541_17695 [Pedobacter sp.]|uniref:hypothetical protein n=1 Tax=Pedobacter sp. TaxID=1411316 RepID=UPI002B6C0B35|nr:hypothetical protein [Pedobacter sp.]HMI04327.1 hypothetical protein [Pedobacter sp.]